jgi:hypothetical protein
MGGAGNGPDANPGTAPVLHPTTVVQLAQHPSAAELHAGTWPESVSRLHASLFPQALSRGPVFLIQMSFETASSFYMQAEKSFELVTDSFPKQKNSKKKRNS